MEMSMKKMGWAGVSQPTHKRIARSVAGALALGMLIPSGMATAAPMGDGVSDDIHLEGAVSDKVVPAVVDESSETPIPENDDVVEFKDSRLKKCVADYFGRAIDARITEADLATISSLNCGFRSIEDISPLAYAVNLEYLVLDQNQLTDVTPLVGLTKLRSLSLSQNQIEDVTALSGLSGLTFLWLGENHISDVEPLVHLTGLRMLALPVNRIADMSPLNTLKELGDSRPQDSWLGLYLEDQQITLPDVASGEPSDLPSVRSMDGSSTPFVIGSGEGAIEDNRVTWSFPEGGEASLGWSQEVTIGEMRGHFSGTVTQKVLPSKPTVPEIVTDHLVLRSNNSYLVRYALSSGPYDDDLAFGEPGDVTFFGDWDGDGVDGIAIRRGNTYYFQDVLGSEEPLRQITFGREDDEVLVGDWDGDGVDTLTVRRGNTYFTKNALAAGDADQRFVYGRASDEVLVGDWDGDGVDGVAVRRGNTYFVKNSITGGYADDEFIFGNEFDEVLVGDWNDDGVDTPLVRWGNRFAVFNDFNDGDAASEFTLGDGSETAYVARLK